MLWDAAQATAFFQLLIDEVPPEERLSSAWQCVWKLRGKYLVDAPEAKSESAEKQGDGEQRDGEQRDQARGWTNKDTTLGLETWGASALPAAVDRMARQWRPDTPRGHCMYAVINPCSLPVALARTLLQAAEDATTEWHTALERNIARCKLSRLLHLDVDTKEASRVAEVCTMLRSTGLGTKVVIVVETKNGLHVLYRKPCRKDGDVDHKAFRDFCVSTEFQKRNRQGKMVTDSWCAVSRGGLMAVPGTLQDGFHVRVVPDLNLFAAQAPMCTQA